MRVFLLHATLGAALLLGLATLPASCGGDGESNGSSSSGSTGPTCDDGELNGDESDVDCGGSCSPCDPGQACGGPADCADGVCSGGACAVAACDDGVQNQDESATDCGGACGPNCPLGSTCNDGGDCVTSSCVGGQCAEPSCSDGANNGAETDVDCGGPECDPCPGGGGCLEDGDCLSLDCNGGTCAGATCSDNIQNQGESDVDCGGPCDGCLPGGSCGVADDCDSQVCAAGICQVAVCQDGVENGEETGVDCGGPSCAKCPQGQGCVNNVDCMSGYCDGATNLCVTYPSCLEILNAGLSTGDHNYSIDPDGVGPLPAAQMYCDMTTDGGGWTRAVEWNRESGSDNKASFLALMTQDFDNMGVFNNQTGFVRWYDNDATYDAMAYHVDIPIPNSGEMIADIHYRGTSMEASAIWFFATAAGQQQHILCWDDTASAIASYDAATEQVWIPSDYSCLNDNPVLTTTTWTWNQPLTMSLGAQVTSFHVHSLHADSAGGDTSDLYRFAIFVR